MIQLISEFQVPHKNKRGCTIKRNYDTPSLVISNYLKKVPIIRCVFNKICNLCCQNKECMELIIFLALVGLGAIILLLWALLTAKDKNDTPKRIS